MAWTITSSSTQEFQCDSCGDMIPKGREFRWNNITHKSLHRTCYDSHILMTGTVSDDGPQVDSKPTHTTPVSTHTPSPTPSPAQARPIKSDAPKAIPEPTKAIPATPPATPSRKPLGQDLMTQAVVEVVDTLLEDRLQSIEERLTEFAKPTEIVNVVEINIPSINVTKRLPNGTHPLLTKAIALAMSGIRVWFQGPAGSGKSMLGAQMADTIERKFMTFSLASGSTKSEATGYKTMAGEYVPTMLYNAVKNGNCVLLIDEFDNCSGNLATALNTGLANRLWEFCGEQVEEHPTCVIIIATNTNMRGNDPMYPSREGMDVSTTCRFARLYIDYNETNELAWALGKVPTEFVEVTKIWVKHVQTLRSKVGRNQLAVTPRASIFGAQALATGLWSQKDFSELEDIFIFQGCDESIKMMVKGATR